MEISLRHEFATDYQSIKQIYYKSFGRDDEARAIEGLRTYMRYIAEFSLIAEMENRIVGHCLFFPVRIVRNHIKFASLALAPICVHPEYYGENIETRLLEAGISIAEEIGCTSILAIGSWEFFSKFGFELAQKWNIKACFNVPEQYFLVKELKENGGLAGISGIAHYPEELMRAV